MICPICKNETEIKNKRIGTDADGEPVYNEFAICRDCRKQWNLTDLRAKKAQAAVQKTNAGEAAKTKEISSPAGERPRKKRSDLPEGVTVRRRPEGVTVRRRPEGEAPKRRPEAETPKKRPEAEPPKKRPKPVAAAPKAEAEAPADEVVLSVETREDGKIVKRIRRADGKIVKRIFTPKKKASAPAKAPDTQAEKPVEEKPVAVLEVPEATVEVPEAAVEEPKPIPASYELSVDAPKAAESSSNAADDIFNLDHITFDETTANLPLLTELTIGDTEEKPEEPEAAPVTPVKPAESAEPAEPAEPESNDDDPADDTDDCEDDETENNIEEAPSSVQFETEELRSVHEQVAESMLANEETDEPEPKYSNIPPKAVREKSELEIRENYQAMLDEENQPRSSLSTVVMMLIVLALAIAIFIGCYWFFLM